MGGPDLRAFLRLTPADRRLLARAALLLGMIRVAMPLVPFRTLRRLLAPGRPRHGAGEHGADRIAWAVRSAGRRIPGAAGCLAQALAAEALLRREGIPADLRIGVAKAGGGVVEAHAWVESDGRVVIGGTGLDRFTPVAALEPEVLALAAGARGPGRMNR